jgi:hypothetical protein
MRHWQKKMGRTVSSKTRNNRFLTEVQLAVFREFGVPVRYNRGQKRKDLLPPGKRCEFCSEPATRAAYRIPYTKGVLKHHLRPDFLNQSWNLIATCSDHITKAKWSENRIERYVAKLHERAEHQR